MRLPRGRRLWLKIHLYLGLTAGALLLMLGLTGSILVFGDEIDRALNPKLATAAHFTSATRLSPDEVVAAVERHAGQQPYMLELPSGKGDAYLAFVKVGAVDAEPLSVLVHPQTGEILASRPWGSFFVSFARRLHTELFIGDAGSWIVAAIGLIGLISIGTGLYLWWPRGGAWRRALTFHWHRYPAAVNFEVHRICGFYLLIALFGIVLSGVYLAAPGPFDSALGAEPYPENVALAKSQQGAQRVSLERVARALEGHVPGASLTGFYIPSRNDEPFVAYYRGPGEPHSHFGRSAAWIDPFDAHVIRDRAYRRMGGVDRLLSLQLLLHNGEIVGAAGRWIVLACGLAMVALFATGFYLWWVKRR